MLETSRLRIISFSSFIEYRVSFLWNITKNSLLESFSLAILNIFSFFQPILSRSKIKQKIKSSLMNYILYFDGRWKIQIKKVVFFLSLAWRCDDLVKDVLLIFRLSKIEAVLSTSQVIVIQPYERKNVRIDGNYILGLVWGTATKNKLVFFACKYTNLYSYITVKPYTVYGTCMAHGNKYEATRENQIHTQWFPNHLFISGEMYGVIYSRYIFHAV